MDISSAITTELARLIAFAPVTGHHDAVVQLLDYVEGEFTKCGLITKRDDIQGFPYLLAGTKSATQSKVLLQAHIDVVPAHKNQFVAAENGGKLYGRGAYDMLFAAAAYLVLIRELKDTNELMGLDIGVMLTSDEEVGGMNGVGALAQDYTCDVCFLPDAGTFHEAAVASKGVLQLQVTALGIAGHSSRPAHFQNPIVPLAAFVADLEALYPNTDTTQTTCAITQFHAGEASNQVPGTATLTLDVRYNPVDEPDKLLSAIAKAASMRGLEVNELDRGDATQIDPASEAFIAFKDIYKQETGDELGMMIAPGSSDARFFATKGTPVIMVRPHGGELHGDNEWVDTASLTKFYQLLKRYVLAEATE